jgi:hypothetical protein
MTATATAPVTTTDLEGTEASSDWDALRAVDRCDFPAVVGTKSGGKTRGSCNAQAYVRFLLPSGGELIACSHHADAHLPALTAAGGHIVTDQRDTINDKPSQSSA